MARPISDISTIVWANAFGTHQFKQRIEYSGSNPIYVGTADPSAAEGDEVWQIKKLTYSGDNVTEINFAQSTAEFKFSWTNRASYSYG
jgi:hypothetical protein